jgi:HlyD family secretion protein
VKFRIDAFNFSQWGMLEGNVSEIANDISVSENGVPTFMIRCKLNSKQLTYQGKKVTVKKGMTVNANFFLIQRTLAQMFYDNITDWFDPNQIEK